MKNIGQFIDTQLLLNEQSNRCSYATLSTLQCVECAGDDVCRACGEENGLEIQITPYRRLHTGRK